MPFFHDGQNPFTRRKPTPYWPTSLESVVGLVHTMDTLSIFLMELAYKPPGISTGHVYYNGSYNDKDV